MRVGSGSERKARATPNKLLASATRERATRKKLSRAQPRGGATRNSRSPRTLSSGFCYSSGGAGNRTPVREEIDHNHYVRSPQLNVSTRWLADGPRMDEPS